MLQETIQLTSTGTSGNTSDDFKRVRRKRDSKPMYHKKKKQYNIMLEDQTRGRPSGSTLCTADYLDENPSNKLLTNLGRPKAKLITKTLPKTQDDVPDQEEKCE